MMLARQPSFRLSPNDLPANAHYIDSCVAAGTMMNEIAACQGDKLTVVFFTAPWCPGCKRLYPKFIQIASNNPSVNFKVVCVADDALRAWAQDCMRVSRLPYFCLFVEGESVSAFSASLTSINVLRAEIAAHTPCTDQLCTTN